MKALIKRIHIINDDETRELIKTRFTGRSEIVDVDSTRKQVKAFTGAKYVHLEFEER